MSLLADVFLSTGHYPWEVMALPLQQRTFVIAAALWKQKQARLALSDDEPEAFAAEDQMAQVESFAARFGGLEIGR